jgi:glutamyl-Q tRNA(Asp) synthetase
VASYLQAKSSGGQWLIRVEDIDPPREVAGSADRILQDLNRFGMQSDQPVLYQSQRSGAHELAITALLDRGLAYHCGCSRSELPASGVYPGTCRDGLPKGKIPRSVRLRVSNEPVSFTDLVQGQIQQDLQESVGDFVIRRVDGLAAYHLAVVVDDAFQGVTEVVRGADLLASTARQIHLQNCLGLVTPVYAHHPVAVGADGRKLSKRLGSDPVSSSDPSRVIEMALEFLGQPCPPELNNKELWSWAADRWRLSRIQRSVNVILNP